MNLNAQTNSLRRNSLVITALLVTVTLLSACSQGGISGRVMDSSGDPLAGVTARLAICTGDDCKAAYEVTTTTDGGYAFEGVELGQYTLILEWGGPQACSGLPLMTREGFRIYQTANEAGGSTVVGEQEIDYVSHEQSFQADLTFPCR